MASLVGVERARAAEWRRIWCNVLGITVNRWAHGYAYQYNSLWDPFWLAGGEPPCERARKRFGLIAIANADAGAYAYADGAIDHAHRAINELVGPARRG
jgi:spermidine dehydrogenase